MRNFKQLWELYGSLMAMSMDCRIVRGFHNELPSNFISEPARSPEYNSDLNLARYLRARFYAGLAAHALEDFLTEGHPRYNLPADMTNFSEEWPFAGVGAESLEGKALLAACEELNRALSGCICTVIDGCNEPARAKDNEFEFPWEYTDGLAENDAAGSDNADKPRPAVPEI